MVNVLISGESSDANLESIVFKVIDKYGKIQPSLTQYNQTIQLEAKRDGNDKDGRQYAIKAIAEDKAGNITEATAQVVVPHDQPE